MNCKFFEKQKWGAQYKYFSHKVLLLFQSYINGEVFQEVRYVTKINRHRRYIGRLECFLRHSCKSQQFRALLQIQFLSMFFNQLFEENGEESVKAPILTQQELGEGGFCDLT